MSTEIQLLIFVLFLVAIASGWWLGQLHGRKQQSSADSKNQKLPKEYLQGISLLLNEQQDQAIDVFLKLFEVNQDTIETHFALGSLYRRRGEVDRALRIHQNLLARPNLEIGYRNQALYELAEDYLNAGVLDRAENLYTDLVDKQANAVAALTRLLRIYEKQSDWAQAVEAVKKLERISQVNDELRDQLAHYYCELADQALAKHEFKLAEQFLRKALSAFPDNIRANLLMAQRAEAMQNARLAIYHYQRIIELDLRYTGEVFTDLERNYQALDEQKQFKAYLKNLTRQNDAAVPYILLALQMYRVGDVDAALDYVTEYLNRDASLLGIAHILSFVTQLEQKNTRLLGLQRQFSETHKHGESAQINYTGIESQLNRILKRMYRYQCQTCGYTSNTLNWQCPSCHRWSTTAPVRDVVNP